MKAKRWVMGWLAIVASVLVIIWGFVYYIDPYFHYHKPHIDKYYYNINNQRSQNDGISKHFDYNALITGTSMTENFKTTELDEIFGVKSIKVPYSGGTYKEMNDNLINALEYNHNLKMVVRGLDTGKFFDTFDQMCWNLGKYPTYLYDDNPFNDVNYLFNKDVIFSRAYAMTQENDADNFHAGITLFNVYSEWQSRFPFGINIVASDGVSYNGAGEAVHLSDDEKEIIYENITRNVTSLADRYPDVEFYYFFTPYSILWYKELVENGKIYRQIEAEQYIIELILSHENIKLFSFNGIEDMITDINNYKDNRHYGAWVNSYMLKCMHDNKYRLTADNYKSYLEHEFNFVVNYDYNSLNGQTDYENDYYAAALMNRNIWNVEPIDVLEECADFMELSDAGTVSGQYEGSDGIKCIGNLDRDFEDDGDIADYIRNEKYVGAKILIDSIGKHNYLTFYGKRVSGNAQPTVLVFDSDNDRAGKLSESYRDLDNEWHQYVIDLSGVESDITVYFNGGSVDNTGSPESEYIFSNIVLY